MDCQIDEGGKKFSVLDLSQAYQQLELEAESQTYTVINTHKGLFSYTRLPYGIASSPGIFQRAMDSLLQGIEGVVPKCFSLSCEEWRLS